MPITTDFLQLYQELRVAPDCSLTHFKHAYRRRVAELHPDRMPPDARPASAERLQALLRLHDAAMKFYDRHGRLPGANQMTPNPVGNAPTRPKEIPSPPRSSRIWIYGTAAAIAAIVCVLLPSVEFSTPDLDMKSDAIPEPVYSGEHHPRTLSRGMVESEVRSIQGEPTLESTDRWEYGPSYVRFEHHKLVGWYSSPLRPLKIAVARRPASKDLD